MRKVRLFLISCVCIVVCFSVTSDDGRVDRAVPRLPLASKAEVLFQVRIVVVVATTTTGAIALLVTLETAIRLYSSAVSGVPSRLHSGLEIGPSAGRMPRTRPTPSHNPDAQKEQKKKKDEE